MSLAEVVVGRGSSESGRAGAGPGSVIAGAPGSVACLAHHDGWSVPPGTSLGPAGPFLARFELAAVRRIGELGVHLADEVADVSRRLAERGDQALGAIEQSSDLVPQVLDLGDGAGQQRQGLALGPAVVLQRRAPDGLGRAVGFLQPLGHGPDRLGAGPSRLLERLPDHGGRLLLSDHEALGDHPQHRGPQPARLGPDRVEQIGHGLGCCRRRLAQPVAEFVEFWTGKRRRPAGPAILGRGRLGTVVRAGGCLLSLVHRTPQICERPTTQGACSRYSYS